MNINSIFFYVGGILILALFFIKKERKKTYGRVFGAAIFFIIGYLWIFPFLPREIFGEWNSIKKLKNKQIVQIILQPSLPGWKVNLTDTIINIYDKGRIEAISNLLGKSQIYFTNRYSEVWETTIILVSNSNDSLSLKIEKTTNETEINNEFRNDSLGKYLEKITGFLSPSIGGSRIKN
ncbi:MAG: hypothetical protein ABJB11_21405 [Ferruginibacter sp.]